MRTALIPLVFLGGALFMAALTAAIGVSAVNAVIATLPEEIFAAVSSGGSFWVVATFQLLGMGFLSPLAFGLEISAFGSFTSAGSVFFVPWQVPIGGIVAVALTHRFLGGNLRTSHTGTRFLLAALSGIGFATVLTILVSAIRFRSDAGLDGSLWAHAASVPGFLVAGLLVGTMTFLLLMPHRGVVLQRIMTAAAAVTEHVVMLAGLAAVAILIWVLVEGETEAALMVLFGLFNIGFMAVSMAHFIPTVTASSEGMMGSTHAETLTLFDLPTAAWIIVLVVMLLAILLAALRWSLRTRFHAHAVWAWISLPVAYLAVGVLLTAANGLYASMFAAGEGIRASVQSAAWGFLVWALLGALIQLLAATLMPRVVHQLPAGLVRALGTGLAVPPTSAPTAAGSDTPAGPPPPPVPDHEPAEQPHNQWHAVDTTPREPRKLTRKTKIILGSAAGVVLLAGIAWGAYAILARTMFGPQHTAEAYLQAVIDGRAEDALTAMGPNVTDELRVLATDEIYQAAENRPDSFELGDVHQTGSTATVEATVHQSGKAYPVDLHLNQAGTQSVVFNDWALDAGDVAGRAVYLSGPTELTVNAVDVDIQPAGQSAADQVFDPYLGEYSADAVAELAAESGQVLLPGTYTFTAPEGSTYLSSGDDLELTITPGELAETPIEFSQGYTEAFAEDVITQVEQRLEACVADGTIRIDDCEAASWEDTIWEAMTDIERTWDTPPVIEVVPVDSDEFFGSDVELSQYSGPVVARVTDGRIDISYQVRDREDQDWMERDRSYDPFRTGFYEPMEFPVTVEGDELNIDFAPLDEYNPDWLSADFR